MRQGQGLLGLAHTTAELLLLLLNDEPAKAQAKKRRRALTLPFEDAAGRGPQENLQAIQGAS